VKLLEGRSLSQPHPRPASRELAARLRRLREEWGLTQPQLASVLGVGPSIVSMWEKETTPRIPPLGRLEAYAAIFSTKRSLSGKPLQLLPEEQLTEDEQLRRSLLAKELSDLRTAAVQVGGPAAPFSACGRFWRFADGAPVRIICGKLPRERRPEFARGSHPNYIQLAAYADVDALIELFGHIRAANAESDVRFELAARLESDDLPAHLVLLGGQAYDQVSIGLRSQIDLPIRRLSVDEIANGEVLEVDGNRYYPEFDEDGKLVTQDVGLLARTPNPFDPTRTLTICSGVFTRGVYGAVRCMTDGDFRAQNEAYLADRFGDAKRFTIVMRVPVIDHATATPDLGSVGNRLYEFPAAG
jgi:transcriptional regulator with XRE-family HTH domain